MKKEKGALLLSKLGKLLMSQQLKTLSLQVAVLVH